MPLSAACAAVRRENALGRASGAVNAEAAGSSRGAVAASKLVSRSTRVPLALGQSGVRPLRDCSSAVVS
jgi:hypothetical protein